MTRTVDPVWKRRLPRSQKRRLDAWKREAMAVIGAWEKVWVALGEPGALGALKSTNSLAAVQQLVADRDRLRDAERLGLPWHYGDADDTTDLFTLFIEQVHARAAQR